MKYQDKILNTLIDNTRNNRVMIIEKAKKEAYIAKKRFDKFQTLLASNITSKGFEISIKTRQSQSIGLFIKIYS